MPDTYRRTGPEAKCPACGWRIDPDAYRCPKCLIYFCYKCRKRVQKADDQFQCVNQTCGCHGKLICAACTVMVPEFSDVTRRVLQSEEVIIPGLMLSPPNHTNCNKYLFVVACIGTCAWLFASFWIGVGVALAAHIVGVIICEKLGIPWQVQPATYHPDICKPATYTEKTTREQVREHRCCIQCRTPVEILGC